MMDVPIDTDMIRLGALLKLAGAMDSGGESKMRIAAGDVSVNGEVEVRRGRHPVHLVRLHQAPFTDRLVAKFDLPVEGWRGSSERRRNSAQPAPSHKAETP